MRALRVKPSAWHRAVLASLLLHGLLLFGYVSPHVGSVVRVPAANAVRLRLLSPVSTPVPAAVDVPSESEAQGQGELLTAQLSSWQTALVAGAAPTQAQSEPESVLRSSATPAETPPENTLDYVSAQGLNPPPRPLTLIDPAYPAAAGMQEGSVVLRIFISAAGAVERVVVVRSTPPGLFDDSAVRAFSAAKFSPGYFLGIAVRSQLLIEVGYTPTNRGAAVSGNGLPTF